MSCSARPNPEDLFTKSDIEHDNHCKAHRSKWNCDPAEGCDWVCDSGFGAEVVKGKVCCRLLTKKNLGSVYLNGGWGFGKICLNREFTRLIILFIYPPLYVFLREKQRSKPFENKKAIIMCFIYTSMFYFPGLIFALHYKLSGGEGTTCLL